MNRRVIVVLVFAVVAVAIVAMGASSSRVSIPSLWNDTTWQAWLDPIRHHPLLPVFILSGFLLASTLFISVWLCIAQTALLLPPWPALAMSMLGAVSAATLFYGLGRWVASKAVQQRLPTHVHQRLQNLELEGMLLIRLVPILPFTLVNLACGSFEVPLHRFVLGTVIGMLPGMVVFCLLGPEAIDVIRHPTPMRVVVAVAAAVALVAMVYGVRVWAQRRAHGRTTT
jgi:phospholipase D1/2